MPEFWEEYDRGTATLDEVTDTLCRIKGCSRDACERLLAEAIARQEPIAPTERLLGDLKRAGYRLYVLSNMSREFIDFLRRQPVYGLFDGEVVSCEERTVKPEPRIYELLLERYGLDPAETLFVDDRPANVSAAQRLGIGGFLFDYRDPQGVRRPAAYAAVVFVAQSRAAEPGGGALPIAAGAGGSFRGLTRRCGVRSGFFAERGPLRMPAACDLFVACAWKCAISRNVTGGFRSSC